MRISPLVAVLAAVASVGCSHSEALTPWFKVVTRPPLVEVPHALRIGKFSARALTKVDGEWHEVMRSEGLRFRANLDGSAVLGEERLFLHEQLTPLRISPSACQDVTGGPRGESVGCLTFNVDPAAPACALLEFTEYGAHGGILRTLRSPDPLDRGACAWNSRGAGEKRHALAGYSSDGMPVAVVPLRVPRWYALVLLRDGKAETQALLAEPAGPEPLLTLVRAQRERGAVLSPVWPQSLGQEPAGQGPLK